MYNVSSLFTKVPIDKAIKIVAKKLEDDETLEDRTTLSASSVCQLTELCLRSTFFHQNGAFLEQTDSGDGFPPFPSCR